MNYFITIGSKENFHIKVTELKKEHLDVRFFSLCYTTAIHEKMSMLLVLRQGAEMLDCHGNSGLKRNLLKGSAAKYLPFNYRHIQALFIYSRNVDHTHLWNWTHIVGLYRKLWNEKFTQNGLIKAMYSCCSYCEPLTYTNAISRLLHPYAQSHDSRYRLKAGSAARRLYYAAILCCCSLLGKRAYL
jgi:hypothetical protein